LSHLIENEPPMVAALPRQPGQKEGRFAHLLSGEPDIPEPALQPVAASTGLAARVAELETELQTIRARLAALEDNNKD